MLHFSRAVRFEFVMRVKIFKLCSLTNIITYWDLSVLFIDAALVEWYWQGRSNLLRLNLSQCHCFCHKYRLKWLWIEPASSRRQAHDWSSKPWQESQEESNSACNIMKVIVIYFPACGNAALLSKLTCSHNRLLAAPSNPGLRFTIVSSAALRLPSWLNSSVGWLSSSIDTFRRYLRMPANTVDRFT